MDFFINMTDGIASHWSSTEGPNAVSGVNWPRTLTALADAQRGPRLPGRIEINSHGLPGRLMLQPEVNALNVGQFAGLLRRLIGPGSMIEILACMVANVDQTMPTKLTDAGESKRSYEVLMDAFELRTTTANSPADVLAVVTKALAMGRDGTMPDDNGPQFCADLATMTGARVRAALYIQTEEDEASGNKLFSTPIGNWEGHVLDFLPGDVVRYAGFNLPRNVFRTHDQHGDGPLRAA